MDQNQVDRIVDEESTSFLTFDEPLNILINMIVCVFSANDIYMYVVSSKDPLS